MDNTTGVTIHPVAGQTVVINNKRDGIKKYATAAGIFCVVAILNAVIIQYPQYSPIVLYTFKALTAMGFFGAGVALTSPFDKRGVILHQNGSVTGDKV